MSQIEIKAMYLSLLESGELYDLFPGLVGDWLSDKVEFTSQYNDTETILDNIDEEFDY